ncbi:Crossover junction endodeoxyribonuclease RuvC [Xanthomonas sacchari]|nr:Crossover junction endodeoxyribonuclease RuvC [Xanthomonas sacchari]MCW0386085.1 Crossover junction endodeoxyribonuclease RuvC [Xanthomonas sacchari]MCW0403733.1 Crossover junction endodeoxyribonuclease RuvC [Xanthomonas sacchari]MCW0413539.1 Crossover junction endodeoxyribonuclease RuvC [Xanthomonas sacchari]MCW0415964.1 Crossover junction endodeoxyribonuclease RuvC [Xanthomonas sacchari]
MPVPEASPTSMAATGISARTGAAFTIPDSRFPNPGSTRILGIDPGSQRTGVGIIDVDAAGRTRHVHHAPLVLLGEGDFALRLKRLLHGLDALIEEYRPQEVAIERVFMGKSADAALKLGHARGAAICAAVLRELPVHEYAAKEIKLAVVGKGAAEKQQVQHMVGLMLSLTGKLQADAADALAVAITHAHVRATAQRLGVSTQQAWSRK